MQCSFQKPVHAKMEICFHHYSAYCFRALSFTTNTQKITHLHNHSTLSPQKPYPIHHEKTKLIVFVVSSKHFSTMAKVPFFQSKYPSCTILMKRTNVGYKLRFPRRFSNQIPFRKQGTLIFEGETGKEWPAQYYDEGYEGRSSIVVAGGWKYFVKDNFIKIGDTCGLELLPHRRKTTLRVTIFWKSRLDDSDSDSDDDDDDGERIPPSRSNVVSNGRSKKAVKKSKMFKPETSRFFKIVHQKCVDRGTLLIPEKFARKHQNELPNKVFLNVPSGAEWEVEVVHGENKLWLQKGWRAFQKYYSIAHGTFLVFEYKGGNSFDVTIFDTSTLEIDYPCGDDDSEEPVVCRECKQACKKRTRDDNLSADDTSVDDASVDESLPLIARKRAKSPFPSPQPPKMGRTTFGLNSARKSKLNISNSAKRDNAYISSQKHGEYRMCKNTEVLRNTRTVKTRDSSVGNSQNYSRGFKEAAGSESENLSFDIVMRASYLCGYFTLIPFSFAKTHLKQESGSVILQISKNETWKVAYKTYSERRVAQLKSGWSAFVEANKLQLGDKCIFELINPAECRLKVVIVRAGKGKVPKVPEPTENYLGRKTKTTFKLKSSAPQLQTRASPVAAQSIPIKIEDS